MRDYVQFLSVWLISFNIMISSFTLFLFHPNTNPAIILVSYRLTTCDTYYCLFKKNNICLIVTVLFREKLICKSFHFIPSHPSTQWMLMRQWHYVRHLLGGWVCKMTVVGGVWLFEHFGEAIKEVMTTPQERIPLCRVCYNHRGHAR